MEQELEERRKEKAKVIILLITGLLIFISHFALITYGSFQLIGEELRGDSYDSLGESLLEGRADVRPSTINWEGIEIDGKVYMYQGPFPAFLRVIFNVLYPSGHGKWSRVSGLLASILTVVGFTLLLHFILYRRREKRLSLLIISILAFSLGSPLVFLISSMRIYHEPIVWGLCFSVWAIYFLRSLFFSEEVSSSQYIGFSFCAGAALLSRVTFALPLYGIISTFIIIEIWNRSSIKKCFALLSFALPAGLFQLWYNYARFNSIFEAFDTTHFYLKPEEFGGFFNVARIANGIFNFLWPRLSQISLSSPWFQQVAVQYWNPELFMGWREQTISLFISSPFIAILGSLGVGLLLLRNASRRLRFVLLAFALQGILICSYYLVSERFSAELMPFFIVGTMWFFSSGKIRRKTPLILGALMLLSVVASLCSTASWHIYYAVGGTDIPSEYQQRLRALFHPQETMPPWEGERAYLKVEDAVDLVYGFMPPRSNLTFNGEKLSSLGQPIKYGIGMHAPTTIKFRVPSNAVAFEGIAALGDSALNCFGALFSVRVQQENSSVLFDSGPIGMAGAPLPGGGILGSFRRSVLFRVNVLPNSIVSIEVDPLEQRDCDHVQLLNAAFLLDAKSQNGKKF
ncbi:MAG: hypothetical protein GYA55_07790 [SAR324 cluster bacterium]|uniref:Glycosyltransferase RgtA/B/C/D-like domain-containing protein n=1 Tax=SAR324 cluster bacterium TaxID=2024889 RepID=A0A7X9IJV8_9DELT|nr:hypothetical protein [SAR324 cluster bacterium]